MNNEVEVGEWMVLIKLVKEKEQVNTINDKQQERESRQKYGRTCSTKSAKCDAKYLASVVNF